MGNGIVKEKNRKIIFDKGCSRIRKIFFVSRSSSEEDHRSNFDTIEGPPGIRGESKKILWN